MSMLPSTLRTDLADILVELASYLRSSSPPTNPPADPALEAIRSTLLSLHNQARSSNSPLSRNSILDNAAQQHAVDMSSHNNLSHPGSDGSSPFDRMKKLGYLASSDGENIAQGFQDPKSVISGWLSSPGHRANILSTIYKDVGFGVSKSLSGQLYWCADFGASGSHTSFSIHDESKLINIEVVETHNSRNIESILVNDGKIHLFLSGPLVSSNSLINNE